MVQEILLQNRGLKMTKEESLDDETMTLSEKWKEFCDETTIHGFRAAFFSRNTCLKVFWRILLILATLLAGFLFYGVLMQYLKYEFKVSKEIDFNMDEVNFPRVTICNINSLSQKKINELGYQGDVDELIDFYHQMRGKTLNVSSPDTKRILNYFYAKNLNKTHDIISAFELGKREMLDDPFMRRVFPFSCKYENKPCSVDNFTEIFSFSYGKCIAFPKNKKDVLKGKFSGPGLQLTLNIHEEDMLDSRATFNGLAVFIHHQRETYRSDLSKKVFVPPGTMNNIHITVSMLESLPPPYSTKCGSKKYEVIDPNFAYSANLCAVDCISKIYSEECGCLTSDLKKFQDNIPECSMEQYDCYVRVYNHLLDNRTYRKCYQTCPTPCTMETFSLQTGQAKIGTKFLYKRLSEMRNLTFQESQDYISHNVVGLNIAFADVIYTKEKLTPSVDWKVLLATIGGSLGLCLGCSLITIIEFIVFCLTYLPFNKRKTQPSTK
ncbi:acid-sensing ion channel 5-like [Clytia hemisphaerica]|uniref:Uncharacterized protein n=1 Tax=Clytia hemisphaerica TaxID=252671 RepID=A0A7M5TUH9_9CNID